MRLTVEQGSDRHTFQPQDAPVEIGRAPSARLRFAHPLVSRLHGCFTWDGDCWHYEDRGRHGTLLRSGDREEVLQGNAAPLPEQCELLLAGDGGVSLRCRTEAGGAALPVREVFQAAVAARARGETRAALEGFLQLARREPPVVEALRRAVECLEVLGRLPEALVWATRYALHRSGDPAGWKTLARLHGQKGELADARYCLERARALDAGDPELAEIEKRLATQVAPARVLELATVDVLGSGRRQTLDTEHFRIDYDFAAHGRLMPDLAKALETAVDRSRGVLPEPGEAIPVELVERASGKDDGPALGDRHAAASCDEHGVRLYLPPGGARAVRDAPFLVALALHEVVHALLLQVSAAVPWWVHEGLAQYLSTGGRFEGCAPAPLRVPELAGLEDAPPAAALDAGYALAYFAVAELWRTAGEAGIKELLCALGEGAGTARAVEHAGTSLADLARNAWEAWRKEVPADPNPMVTLDDIERRSP